MPNTKKYLTQSWGVCTIREWIWFFFSLLRVIMRQWLVKLHWKTLFVFEYSSSIEAYSPYSSPRVVSCEIFYLNSWSRMWTGGGVRLSVLGYVALNTLIFNHISYVFWGCRKSYHNYSTVKMCSNALNRLRYQLFFTKLKDRREFEDEVDKK